jgi:hypothetical protein
MMNIQSKLGVLVASASLLVFAGCNSGTGTNTWSIEGVDGPHVDYATNQMTITATFKNVQIVGGATVPIPNMPNSTIELAPDAASGGLLLSATINAKDVAALVGSTVLNPTTLPGGRPLPGVAAGQLPAIAVQVPALDNITFYIGPQIFGLFAPVGFSLNQIIGTFSFYDNSGNHLGNLSVVGEDANKANSGFLLLINTTSAGGVMLDKGLLDLN